MKILLSLFMMMVIGHMSQAQLSQAAQMEKEHIIEIVNLDENLQEKLEALYQKRITDLAEISSLEQTNPEKWKQKRRAAYAGMYNSIKLLMSQNGITSYDEFEIELRTQRAEISRELVKAGADKDRILDAQVGIIE